MEQGTIVTLSSRLTTEEIFETAKNLYKAGYDRIEVTRSRKDGKTCGIVIRYGRGEEGKCRQNPV